MKRDMDLIREMLFKIEASDGPVDASTLVPQFPGHDDQVIYYHYDLLKEAGFLNDGYLQLSWIGHDFLDAIKDDTVWKNVKGELKKNSLSAPFDLIKSLAMKFLSAAIGLS